MESQPENQLFDEEALTDEVLMSTSTGEDTSLVEAGGSLCTYTGC